jgi:hypothetical protein
VLKRSAELFPAVPGRNDYRHVGTRRARRPGSRTGLNSVLNKSHKVCV